MLYRMVLIAGVMLCCSCSGSNNQLDDSPDPVPEENGTGIEWEPATMVKIADGNYARIKELDNEQLIAVYSRGKDVYIKYSNDRGSSWENEKMLFQGNEHYIMTNAEAIQLSDKSLIVGCNRRVEEAWLDKDYRYAIAVRRSTDYGETWTESMVIYKAGNNQRTGCWEPAFLQLPSGEVHCYFANEFPYPSTTEQEISLLRSFDNGETWTAQTETACFAQGSRDGMPVPLLYGEDILLAIEDNSNDHVLQPTIIREPVKDNWKNGFVSANDINRIPVCPYFDSGRYAGAPYIANLATGEILVSFQDRYGRQKSTDLMKVVVGEGIHDRFQYMSVPFSIGIQEGTNWNSLCVLSSGEIIAVTQTNAFNRGVYMIKGQWVKRP